MREIQKLNLARAWRPKTFEEMIGQPLVVKSITNSLRHDMLFPVYLLAGMRGTGKTSMGRMFAAAINCAQRSAFREGTYDGPMPCGSCDSCRAMAQGTHPDSIEIDAASHTGVDHVRQIIDESLFLPVMGTKKVYLIDEAHMLSKAAWNAFLKILEEPPVTALFLLATTDPHKIIDTVRSRCFQLFFDPIPLDALVGHLAHVCDEEKIGYEQEALRLIARSSEGAVRDALNALERVRLSETTVSEAAVRQVLGILDDESALDLLRTIAQGEVARVLELCRETSILRSPELLWESLVAGVRSVMWLAAGVKPNDITERNYEICREIAEQVSFELAVELLEILYRAESYFLKTASPQILLERVICSMAQRCGSGKSVMYDQPARSEPVPRRVVPERSVQESAPHKRVPDRSDPGASAPAQVGQPVPSQPRAAALVEPSDPWQKFMARSVSVGDPLARSVLVQGVCLGSEGGIIRVQFPKKFVFYQEALVASRRHWQPLLEEVFGEGATLVPDFSRGDEGAEQPVRSEMGADRPLERTVPKKSEPKKFERAPAGAINVADGQWKTAQALQQIFPGTIKIIEISENKNQNENRGEL